MFAPRLSVLPPSQLLLWDELKETPQGFVLYGGTAVALHLGHRQSVDFDFFSNRSFNPADLISIVPYLRTARIDQRGDNTLTASVEREGTVKVSFFGDVRMNRVHAPEMVGGHGLQIASLLDLTATKLKTIQQRAETKDYRDIAAAMDAGIALEEAMGAAYAIYGGRFNALAALKALTYFEDGNLPSLPQDMRERLRRAAGEVNWESLPTVAAEPGITSAGG